LNNVLNCDEHSVGDDNDEFDNETLEEANDMDVEIVSSIGSANSQRSSCSSREDEAAGNQANQETSFGANDDTQLDSKKILLVQPSSAAVERVFSLLNSGFVDQQEQSLQNYIEASVMLRYNNH